MTSWIDASFVYSTKEAWVNAMRSFRNGTFKMEGDTIFGLPPKNADRIPLQNHPAPHVLRMLPPERMFRKSTLINQALAGSTCLHISLLRSNSCPCAN